MPRIILTVTNDLTYDQRMIRIATSLVSFGYEVLLVGREKRDSQPIRKQVFQQKRLHCFFNKGKFFYIEYNFRLFLYLLFAKYEVLCSIDLDTIMAGYYATKLRNKKLVYDAHEYFTEVPELVNRPKVKAIWEWVANKTIPNIQHAYTVCESLQQVFEERYHTKFELIRNVPFAISDRPKMLTFAHPIILLYQGALNDGRGLEEMIAAMKGLSNCEFWMAGEGDLSDDLRTLVKSLNLEKQVQFLGYIQPHELTTITTKAHIGVNLLQNKGLNYYYSLANKFFDYIQAGKPSLNMNFPEYAAINKQYEVSLLVDDLKADSIIAAVSKIIQNDTLYQELSNNCHQAAKFYIWEKEELKLKAFYEQVLEK